MYFKQFLNETCGCASYVIASRRSHEAAIIDPASETEPYEALLRERGFRLRYVIDTHIHADHVSGASTGRPVWRRALPARNRAGDLPISPAQRPRGIGAGAVAPSRFAYAGPPSGIDIDLDRESRTQPRAVDGLDG